MPLELDIIRASEFMRLDPHEHLDFEASRKALQALALACRKRGIACALVDLRSLPVLPKPWFTPSEVAALVRSFQEAGFSRRQRLAVLYHHDVYGGIRNFAFFSRMRGLRVKAFTEFEAALHWLSRNQESESPHHHHGEVAVPIVQPHRHAHRVPVRLSTGRHSNLGTRRQSRRTTNHDN